MDRKLQLVRAEDRPDCSGQRARVSDLIVAYFLRGIRTLDASRRGPALEARRVWAARQEAPAGRRSHSWD